MCDAVRCYFRVFRTPHPTRSSPPSFSFPTLIYVVRPWVGLTCELFVFGAPLSKGVAKGGKRQALVYISYVVRRINLGPSWVCRTICIGSLILALRARRLREGERDGVFVRTERRLNR